MRREFTPDPKPGKTQTLGKQGHTDRSYPGEREQPENKEGKSQGLTESFNHDVAFDSKRVNATASNLANAWGKGESPTAGAGLAWVLSRSCCLLPVGTWADYFIFLDVSFLSSQMEIIGYTHTSKSLA